MPIEKWSDTVVVAHLADDPQFTDDMQSVEALIDGGGKDVVLDLTAVHYLNSSNISRLLKLRKLINTSQRRLLLCAISRQVWVAFMATGLDRVFDFSETVPTALATLQLSQSP